MPPRRRRIDRRPSQSVLAAPTPGGPLVADPEGARSSLQAALEAARGGRRDLTLVVMEAQGGEPDAAVAAMTDVARATLRSTDVVWRDGERSLAALLVDTDGLHAEAALARLGAGLDELDGLAVRVGRTGAVPGIGADDLLELAHLEASSGADTSER